MAMGRIGYDQEIDRLNRQLAESEARTDTLRAACIVGRSTLKGMLERLSAPQTEEQQHALDYVNSIIDKMQEAIHFVR
jgi:hypothetical protein